MGNENLQQAARAKKDEFYTQLADIENELRHYRSHFRGRVVFCNCDDPFESDFFKYFVLNFNRLGLKELLATSYAGSSIANRQLSLYDIPGSSESARNGDKPYAARVTTVRDVTGDGGIDMNDIAELFKSGENSLQELQGDGDFRSGECVRLLKRADIVATNPPFSLFREYVAQLMEYDKKFIIIGHQNAITYKEIFPLLKDNKIWLGNGFRGNVGFFKSPYEDTAKASQHKPGLIRVSGVNWFTNLDIKRRHENLILTKKYSPGQYPRYDNYDAIEVGATANIPRDYGGVMGVPITFLEKYCPGQFEILGLTSGRNEFDKRAWPIKRYENAVQVNPDGTTANGSKANTRATILLNSKPAGVYYKADNAGSIFRIVYARILIINKNPKNDNKLKIKY